MQQAVVDGHIWGVAICRNGPQVSHLFFADDSIFFVEQQRLSAKRLWIFW